MRRARRGEDDAAHGRQAVGSSLALEPMQAQDALRKVRNPHRRTTAVPQVGHKGDATPPALCLALRQGCLPIRHHLCLQWEPLKSRRAERWQMERCTLLHQQRPSPSLLLEACARVDGGLPRVVQMDGLLAQKWSRRCKRRRGHAREGARGWVRAERGHV